MKPFSLDLNLDDEAELEAFIASHGTNKGRSLANTLGLKGIGSAKLASALSNYAWNASTARQYRLRGQIGTALSYEGISDRIYREEIQPVCDCW